MFMLYRFQNSRHNLFLFTFAISSHLKIPICALKKLFQTFLKIQRKTPVLKTFSITLYAKVTKNKAPEQVLSVNFVKCLKTVFL